ncbi:MULTISPECIES: RlmE family RNA methyltransferase [Azospirillaceae]|uniref:RlmE family RNA methyltransferase n=1 Tax=Azospirillaceae TaxID=2829815 RepID=UPI000B66C8FB|nr:MULTISPECIES: RlmE family RNA methyltransferase [Azospirillaceae]MDG5495545.1 RlmE family RNA methyltransferase [Niveispirillum sp. BGYR6]SNR88144.1 23S rRNA Um-2552 2'-O-methyltransferase [Azospirillum sp. RU38E]SNS04320.1 23S rRNA Um-2552 2'-O-methyltransferase [Azospirillum sp. RU37A]
MTKSSGNIPTGRNQAVRVKTAKRRSVSSARWLERQLNDPYVVEAKKRGFRSRAAFKLLQLDEKFGLLKRGQRIVDLGAAPGGWTQVAVEKSKSDKGGSGQVVGLDLLEMEAVPGATTFQMDFTSHEAPLRLKALLQGPADVVMSDMAANTTGHTQTDHLRIMGLAEMAYQFATEVLAPGGHFVCKLFQGGAERELLAQMKKDFTTVRHAKPAASRQDSSETYIVAMGFRGGEAAAEEDEAGRV